MPSSPELVRRRTTRDVGVLCRRVAAYRRPAAELPTRRDARLPCGVTCERRQRARTDLCGLWRPEAGQQGPGGGSEKRLTGGRLTDIYFILGASRVYPVRYMCVVLERCCMACALSLGITVNCAFSNFRNFATKTCDVFIWERGGRDPAPQLRCTGNDEPRRGSRGLIYHAEARRWPCSSASSCASPTMGRRTTTSPMAAPVHLRAGSDRRLLRPLASRAPSAPGAPSAARPPRETG